jgi:hypothetical protein
MTDDRILQINRLHQDIIGIVKMTLDKVITIGQLLSQIKTEIPHGEFGQWCRINLEFSERTVQRYLKVYNNRESVKTDNVSDPTVSRVYNSLVKTVPKPKVKKQPPTDLEFLKDVFKGLSTDNQDLFISWVADYKKVKVPGPSPEPPDPPEDPKPSKTILKKPLFEMAKTELIKALKPLEGSTMTYQEVEDLFNSKGLHNLSLGQIKRIIKGCPDVYNQWSSRGKYGMDVGYFPYRRPKNVWWAQYSDLGKLGITGPESDVILYNYLIDVGLPPYNTFTKVKLNFISTKNLTEGGN